MEKSSKRSRTLTPWFLGIIICFAVVIAYWPAFSAGFVWDDDMMVTGNPAIREPLANLWFTTHPADYFPLTYTSLWLEWRFWGTNPIGYHITNVVLHALSCIVLWRAFARLQIPAAWLAALLFAVHPVNVESVAWIAERKNVLAMFFYAITVWSFIRFTQSREARFYLFSLGAFVLSLLSKPAAAPWPVIAFGLIWLSQSKASKTDAKPDISLVDRFTKSCVWVAPFLVVALILSLVTVWFQNHRAIGADVIYHHENLHERTAIAGRNVWFYLSKALVPYPLSFIYPKWKISGGIAAILPALVVAGVFYVLWVLRHRVGKATLLALTYYILLLTPILGVFNIYFQRYSYVADHWQYFALPAITILVALGLEKLKLHTSVGVALVLVFAGSAFVQARIYHDTETLWLDTLRKNPECWLALNGLGFNRQSAGQLDEAFSYYTRSIEIEPDQPEAHISLGAILMNSGKTTEGIQHFQKAIDIAPHYPPAHYNLATALRKQGKIDEAIAEFQAAIHWAPSYAVAHNGLGRALWLEGKRDEGLAHVRLALANDPNNVDALINLGAFLVEEGKVADGLPLLEKAAALNGANADAHSNLGNALFALKRLPEAREQFTDALRINSSDPLSLYGLANCLARSGDTQQAVELYQRELVQQPDHAEAHFRLAMILSTNKQKDQALEHFRAAARLKPDWLEAVNNLAWFLATDPRSNTAECAQSVRLAEHAVQLSAQHNPVALDTLGVAWARNDVFSKALDAANKAEQLATDLKLTNLCADIRTRIDLYNHRRPYIEP